MKSLFKFFFEDNCVCVHKWSKGPVTLLVCTVACTIAYVWMKSWALSSMYGHESLPWVRFKEHASDHTYNSMPCGCMAVSWHLLILMSCHIIKATGLPVYLQVGLCLCIFLCFYSLSIPHHALFVVTFSCPRLFSVLTILWSVSFHVAPSLPSSWLLK